MWKNISINNVWLKWRNSKYKHYSGNYNKRNKKNIQYNVCYVSINWICYAALNEANRSRPRCRSQNALNKNDGVMFLACIKNVANKHPKHNSIQLQIANNPEQLSVTLQTAVWWEEYHGESVLLCSTRSSMAWILLAFQTQKFYNS